MSEPRDIAVVIAAHEEAGSIGAVVSAALQACPPGSEVIVVDDGSTDDTAQLAGAAGARVIRLAHNRGKGAAMLVGIAATSAGVLVFLDGDGQDDPKEIPTLLHALQPGVDMVIGSRFLGHFHPGAITPLHRWGNLLLTAAINTLFGCRLTDTQAGFRCVNAPALADADLSARRYDFETDVLLGLLASGATVLEVPVQRRPRAHGHSGLSSVRDGLRIASRIVMRRLKRPQPRRACSAKTPRAR